MSSDSLNINNNINIDNDDSEEQEDQQQNTAYNIEEITEEEGSINVAGMRFCAKCQNYMDLMKEYIDETGFYLIYYCNYCTEYTDENEGGVIQLYKFKVGDISDKNERQQLVENQQRLQEYMKSLLINRNVFQRAKGADIYNKLMKEDLCMQVDNQQNCPKCDGNNVLFYLKQDAQQSHIIKQYICRDKDCDDVCWNKHTYEAERQLYQDEQIDQSVDDDLDQIDEDQKGENEDDDLDDSEKDLFEAGDD